MLRWLQKIVSFDIILQLIIAQDDDDVPSDISSDMDEETTKRVLEKMKRQAEHLIQVGESSDPYDPNEDEDDGWPSVDDIDPAD